MKKMTAIILTGIACVGILTGCGSSKEAKTLSPDKEFSKQVNAFEKETGYKMSKEEKEAWSELASHIGPENEDKYEMKTWNNMVESGNDYMDRLNAFDESKEHECLLSIYDTFLNSNNWDETVNAALEYNDLVEEAKMMYGSDAVMPKLQVEYVADGAMDEIRIFKEAATNAYFSDEYYEGKIYDNVTEGLEPIAVFSKATDFYEYLTNELRIVSMDGSYVDVHFDEIGESSRFGIMDYTNGKLVVVIGSWDSDTHTVVGIDPRTGNRETLAVADGFFEESGNACWEPLYIR